LQHSGQDNSFVSQNVGVVAAFQLYCITVSRLLTIENEVSKDRPFFIFDEFKLPRNQSTAGTKDNNCYNYLSLEVATTALVTRPAGSTRVPLALPATQSLRRSLISFARGHQHSVHFHCADCLLALNFDLKR